MRHVLAIVMTTFAGLVGCGLVSEGDQREFLIGVDEVLGPDSITRGEPLVLRFVGWVGGGCSSFSRFTVTRSTDSAVIEVRGVEVIEANSTCPDVVVKLDESLSLAPPDSFPFVVRVRQPRGEITEFLRVLARN